MSADGGTAPSDSYDGLILKNRTITAVDLFCGAGGTSTGLRQACGQLGHLLHLTGINHWDVAIGTHQANHPDAAHYCEDLDNVNPRKLFPDGRIDLLMASPALRITVARVVTSR